MDIIESVNMHIKEVVLKEQYQELIQVFSGIDNWAVVKGAVLSYLCYNNAGHRKVGDIDILIPRTSVNLIENKLLCNDFVSSGNSHLSRRTERIFFLSSSHQLRPYHKNMAHSQIKIDVNFDLFWGEYEGERIDMGNFLLDTIEMDIYNRKVKTLAPLKALIQLILHHYKDMNSIYLLATQKSIKYEMFRDVYYLLKNNIDDIPLERLYAMSVEFHIVPYVFYVLYYTSKIFDDVILKRYMEAFRTTEGELLLNFYGLCNKERKEWRCDFKTRLASDCLYYLIKNDLTEEDFEKIRINRSIFIGE